MSSSSSPKPVSPARFRYTKGWLVFYNQAASPQGDVGEEDFTDVVARIQDERLRGTNSGECAYDVILAHVHEGEKLFPTLVVTTSDPGSSGDNAVLSNLFQHNNPRMHGSVESLSGGELQQLLKRSEASRSIHFDAVSAHKSSWKRPWWRFWGVGVRPPRSAQPSRTPFLKGPIMAVYGQVKEPYCSEACKEKAANTLAFAMVTKHKGPCTFCQTPVVYEVGSQALMFPYRNQKAFLCPRCVPQAHAFMAQVRECCLCGKGL